MADMILEAGRREKCGLSYYVKNMSLVITAKEMTKVAGNHFQLRTRHGIMRVISIYKSGFYRETKRKKARGRKIAPF